MPTPEEIKLNEINEFSIDSPEPPSPGPTDPPAPPPAEPPVPPAPPVEPPTPPPQAPEPPPAVPPVPPVEPPPVEPPAPPTPPVAPPTPPVPPVVKDPRDTQIEDLTKTLGQMREQMENMARQMATPAAPPAPAPKLDAQGQPIVEPPPVVKFLEKEEDLDKMLNSVDNFNVGMTKILTSGTEGVLKNISQIVMPMVTQIVTQKLAVQEFFTHNQDLGNNRAYVGVVANELAAANPTWTLENIIQNLGTEVRKRLAIAGQPVGTPPAGGQLPVNPPAAPTPAFVPGGNARPPSGPSSMTAMEKGINDLIEGFVP